jgi:hypothetical protein
MSSTVDAGIRSRFEGSIMSFLRANGLTIVLVVAALATIGGMFISGWSVYNDELTEHGQAALSAMSYLISGHFLSAIFENWESEFLQMSAYVMLTAMLYQKGSAESKDPDGPIPQDEDPRRHLDDPKAPWPVKAGSFIRGLYSYSLGIALGLLFLLTFVLHLRYSFEAANVEAAMHGQPTMPFWQYLGDAQFWFESFQNWQSEFLSTAVLVVLSIFLRFKGSPESKAVADPTGKTG